MLNRKIIYFFLLFHVFPSGIADKSRKPPFLKLVNHPQTPSVGRMHGPAEASRGDFKIKCLTANDEGPKLAGLVQARFIDLGTNDSLKDQEMEAPAAKFSLFNLLSDEEEEEGEDGDEDLKEDDVSGEDDDFNFFGSDEIKLDNSEGTKEESFLKQYHRQTLRMRHFVFPLLLAYKLKFFTVIPLLLGTLVLLVGTTGVAGFFFALFAAALAITSKNSSH